MPFGTVVIGIPFYLARPELTDLHGEEVGHIEGFNEQRHPPLPAARDGARRQLRLQALRRGGVGRSCSARSRSPTSRTTGRSPSAGGSCGTCPGWYAQKHPDEDWAETFAVWMTPDHDWRADYAQWPTALAKLEYCDRTMQRLAERDPLVTTLELDEDVGELTYSLRDYYKNQPGRERAARRRSGRRLAGDLRRPGCAGRSRRAASRCRNAAGRGADPPAGAAADGRRLSLDRPLSREDPQPDAAPGPAGRGASAGLSAGGREARRSSA